MSLDNKVKEFLKDGYLYKYYKYRKIVNEIEKLETRLHQEKHSFPKKDYIKLIDLKCELTNYPSHFGTKFFLLILAFIFSIFFLMSLF